MLGIRPVDGRNGPIKKTVTPLTGGESEQMTLSWSSRDRIRLITARSRLLVPVEQIVDELNVFLRGWAGYFRYGNSALVLGQIRNYALTRLALWLSKRGKRRRAWGGACPRCCCHRITWA